MIRHRRGLTLIELVLAVAGTSVLLGLIVSVMTSQARLIARSQQSIEITRASLRLSQWLREDLSTLQRRETDGVLDPRSHPSMNECYCKTIPWRIHLFNSVARTPCLQLVVLSPMTTRVHGLVDCDFFPLFGQLPLLVPQRYRISQPISKFATKRFVMVSECQVRIVECHERAFTSTTSSHNH